MFKKYITIICISLSLSGCNFLDLEETTDITKDGAYTYDFNNVNKLVSYVYSFMPQDFGVMGGGALRESATDNAVFTWSNSSIYDIYNNAWGPLNVIDGAWENSYTAIRSANSFLENFSLEKLEHFKWNEDYEENMRRTKRYLYEVRALRAFYFFELTKRYGDILLLTRTYTTKEINAVKKTKFNDVIDFIVKECKEVAPNLPITQKTPDTTVPESEWDDYGLGETGRVTRGMVMALQSRALLYAASKLHNPQDDKTKWEKAASAAYDIIKENWYSLPNIDKDPLYDAKGGHDILKSSQLIFVKRNGSTRTFEGYNLPIGFEGGNSGNTPTQNLVDAFERVDGTAFDWSNPEHVQNMYTDAKGKNTRDPRLYKTVLYNGSVFMKNTIETFTGGKNAYPIEGASLTGYYLRKHMNETVSMSEAKPVTQPHHFVIFRYAEILLNYAEAMNEWKGADYTDPTHPLSAREALRKVRSAANMPLVSEQGEAFTQRLRNERRIELAFEDHRFWDIRRWEIGDVVKGIYGVTIQKVEDGFLFTKAKVQERVWENKMYLYPIPQSEIFKNGNLTQNAGW